MGHLSVMTASISISSALASILTTRWSFANNDVTLVIQLVPPPLVMGVGGEGLAATFDTIAEETLLNRP